MEVSETLTTVFYILIGGGIWILLIAIWFRNRARKRAYLMSDEPVEPVQGTEADLRRAEDAIRGTPGEIREGLLQNHDLIERFSTLQGFTSEYMDQLIADLRAKGIASETYFQETMPKGVGMAILDPVGVHELYVQRDRAKEAAEFVRSRITSKG